MLTDVVLVSTWQGGGVGIGGVIQSAPGEDTVIIIRIPVLNDHLCSQEKLANISNRFVIEKEKPPATPSQSRS